MTIDPLFLVIGFVLVILAIPPRYDPAIRIKEWLNRK